jgi:glycogen debranching enzyme
LEFVFGGDEWVKIHFPVKGKVVFRAITGDMVDAKTQEGDFFIAFSAADTLVGYSPVIPTFKSRVKHHYRETCGVKIWFRGSNAYAFYFQELEGGGYKFTIHHSVNWTLARGGALHQIHTDVDALKKARYDYFKKMPKCKDKRYEQLYYKAISTNKVNVYSPEGNIPCRWTTPDRVPHRHMWLWDSAFHAMAIATYNGELAKEALRAVFAMQRSDGLIATMMTPDACGSTTQPQVLSWAVWSVYQKTGDRAFLSECVTALDRYLTWDMENRDSNGNGLLEWFTEPDYTECKCGESGWDNSPRFEFDEEMDAVDFTAFMSHDAEYLAKIYLELGEKEKAEKWTSVANRAKLQINALLWDEETGAYYDRLMSGKLTKVLSPASFFPMLAGVPTKEQAKKMVDTLTNPDLLWTEMPIPTVSKTHYMYSTDMWRGGVWLNLNYFIYLGLKRYGFDDVAAELRKRILEGILKWYKKTGTISEFYDPENKIAPYFCDRKGKARKKPDWTKKVHSITDFNWSACFTLLFIQEELY